MENIETKQKSIPIPDVLNMDNIPEGKQPTLEDWKIIQGGKPELVPIAPEKGFYHIIHRYINTKDANGSGAIVPTSAPIVKNWAIKKVNMTMPDGRLVWVLTPFLWKYHGKGCEARSGIRYDRVELTSDK